MTFSRCITNLILTVTFIVSNNAISQVSTATDKIVVDSETRLEMIGKLKDECYSENYPHPCFPKTTLTLIYKEQEYSYSSYIAPWEGFFYIHFVKLALHSYSLDLDGDGFKEIAIYPEVAGNAAKTKSYIYTVKGSQLLPYGTADHYWESGKHVTNIKKSNFKLEE